MQRASLLHNAYGGDAAFSHDQFVTALARHLNPKRKNAVLHAFKQLDTDKSGVLSLPEIRAAYSAHRHPEVLSGRLSEEDEVRRFLGSFKAGQRDGDVSLDEWIDYYADVSAAIDDDNFFCTLLWNSWDGASSAGGSKPPPGRSKFY